VTIKGRLEMSVNLIIRIFNNIPATPFSIFAQILNNKFVTQMLMSAFVYMILICLNEGKQRKDYSQVQ
jgi:MFS-type transporter involved in bile tolerance (Atg22 family)